MNQEYVRREHIIKDMAGKVIFTGSWGGGEKKRPSINAAKRESRRLQTEMGKGGLGGGVLRVAA